MSDDKKDVALARAGQAQKPTVAPASGDGMEGSEMKSELRTPPPAPRPSPRISSVSWNSASG